MGQGFLGHCTEGCLRWTSALFLPSVRPLLSPNSTQFSSGEPLHPNLVALVGQGLGGSVQSALTSPGLTHHPSLANLSFFPGDFNLKQSNTRAENIWSKQVSSPLWKQEIRIPHLQSSSSSPLLASMCRFSVRNFTCMVSTNPSNSLMGNYHYLHFTDEKPKL